MPKVGLGDSWSQMKLPKFRLGTAGKTNQLDVKKEAQIAARHLTKTHMWIGFPPLLFTSISSMAMVMAISHDDAHLMFISLRNAINAMLIYCNLIWFQFGVFASPASILFHKLCADTTGAWHWIWPDLGVLVLWLFIAVNSPKRTAAKIDYGQ